MEMATTTALASPNSHYNAYGFAWIGQTLVIAHGALGMMTFDPATHSLSVANNLELSSQGRISKVTNVTPIDDRRALFAVEAVTVSNDTFDGLMEVDIKYPSYWHRFPYDRNASGSLANATVKVFGDQVLINNWGIFHHASLSNMEKTGLTNINWTPISFKVGELNAYGELLGEFILDNGSVAACAEATYTETIGGRAKHIGVVFSSSL